jgi:hypothetical protein
MKKSKGTGVAEQKSKRIPYKFQNTSTEGFGSTFSKGGKNQFVVSLI